LFIVVEKPPDGEDLEPPGFQRATVDDGDLAILQELAVIIGHDDATHDDI
jgi:hypothetical protein